MSRRPKRKSKDAIGLKGAQISGPKSHPRPQQEHNRDPARALITLSQDVVAACCGSTVHAYHRLKKQKIELEAQDSCSQPIRALQISKDATYILAGGDDRMLRIWNVSNGKLLLEAVAGKKISAATFMPDSKFALFADKTGDVCWVAIPVDTNDIESSSPTGVLRVTQPCFLLGHFSTIITSLTVSQCGKRVISTDREGKIRVTRLPSDLSQGAYCIQAVPLGHSAFVTSAVDLSTDQAGSIASGSGDGTLRLWDRESGTQLDLVHLSSHSFQPTSQIPQEINSHDGSVTLAQQTDYKDQGNDQITKQQSQSTEATRPENVLERERDQMAEQNIGGDTGDSKRSEKLADAERDDANEQEESQAGESDEDEGFPEQLQGRENLPPAVIDLAYSNSRKLLAVCLEGNSRVFILSVTNQSKFHYQKAVSISNVHLPNSLAFDSFGNLWAASGCKEQIPFAMGALSHAHLSAGLSEFEDVNGNPTGEICTEETREALGMHLAVAGKEQDTETSGILPGVQVSLELRKWVINEEERQKRKQSRNDVARKPEESSLE